MAEGLGSQIVLRRRVQQDASATVKEDAEEEEARSQLGCGRKGVVAVAAAEG